MENTKNISGQDAVMIAEYRLLNAIMLNKDLINEPDVSKDLLVHDMMKSIYSGIELCIKQNVPLTVNAVFQQSSALDLNVTLSDIKDIYNINTDPNVCLIDIVSLLKSTQNALSALADLESIKSIINNSPIINEENAEKIRQATYSVESKLLTKDTEKRVETFKEWTDDYKVEFESRKNGKKYLFNDPILDKYITYGPAPGSGTLIAAATGMGKSAFCLNLINKMVNVETPCFYYSLEMGKFDTMDRLISLRSKIPLSEIVNPPDEPTWQSIKDAQNGIFEDLIKNNKFRFCESANISLSQVAGDIRKFQVDIGQKYCVVVFDLLSMIKEFMITDHSGINFAQGIEVAINILNALAKELGFHYIAVLQMNRKGEDEKVDDIDDIKKLRPVRTGIKNSGAFLERVRAALGLFRPRYYAEEYIDDTALWENMPDYCQVFSLKQNSGTVGEIGKYLFDGETMSMEPVEDEISQTEEGDKNGKEDN